MIGQGTKFIYDVRWRSFQKVPINVCVRGLRGVGKLADDAHEPVLQILKKQNRELSSASE